MWPLLCGAGRGAAPQVKKWTLPWPDSLHPEIAVVCAGIWGPAAQKNVDEDSCSNKGRRDPQGDGQGCWVSGFRGRIGKDADVQTWDDWGSIIKQWFVENVSFRFCDPEIRRGRVLLSPGGLGP